MIAALLKMGGILPKISDPRLLPEGRSQTAVNCRFDHGGAEALLTDLFNSAPTNPGPILSLFLYQYVGKFLCWNSNVSAITAPLANDSFHRVYYTENGVLKVTDGTLYNQGGGTNYPEAWSYPTPPPPANAPVASHQALANQFNPLGSISLYQGTVLVQGVGLSGINSSSSIMQVKLTGTGISNIDGIPLSFSNVSSAYGNDSFTLVGVSALNTGNIQNLTVANPGIITSNSHGLLTSDFISFAVTGMTQLNTVKTTIIKIDDNTFSIGSTVGYTAFTGGTWSLLSRPLTYSSFPSITVSAITKSNPAKVTSTAHGLVTGDVVIFTVTVGMTQLNGVIAQITVVDVDNFTINNIDSTLYGTFTAGTYKLYPQYESTNDPTLQETVFYVETYVNGYGSEGAPSPVSNLVDIFNGDLVTITDTNTSVDPLYNIVSKNIYRSNRDASGNEILQFLVNIPLATTTYADTTLAAALGLVLTSAEWDAPPAGIEGLVALANQTLAAFQGNLVLFSVPGFPQAWPASYQQPTDTLVMGIGSFGTTAIVLTQGVPYLVTGNNPANYIMDKLGTGYGCVSKRSVVQVGGEVVYAAADGLVAMSPSSEKILTEGLISPEEWQSKYNPTTITGFYWQGHYVAFYTNGGIQAGFYLDPRTGDLVELDFYATAGYHDPVTGFLYLVVNGNIVAFSQGATFRTMSNMSRRYRFLPSAPGAVRVLAKTYPVTISVTYYDENETAQSVSITATGPKVFTHPQTGLVNECEITLSNGVTAVFIAGAIEDITT